jgi:LmbE family N-acetylglucosaminyl deacetylase
VDLLVLSPHLDDAVFACGGMLARAAAEGKRAAVVTFYTGEPTLARVPARLRPFCRYEVRKAEDARAAAALGVECAWVDLVERAFRPPAVGGMRALFTTPTSTAELTSLRDAEGAIESRLDRHPQAQLLAPLGVGNHVDHVELALAALNVMLRRRAFDRFAFYEDSYALGLVARRRHPVTRNRLWSARGAPERSGLRAWLMFGLLALAMRGPSPFDYAPEAHALRWRCEPVALRDEHEAQKLAAVAMYTSQVAPLGGAAGWGAVLRRYHRVFGGAEPRWHATPT